MFEYGEFSPFHEEIWDERESLERRREYTAKVHSCASESSKNRT